MDNYNEVQAKIRAACARAGRSSSEVTLIAVSKTKPVSMMEELISQGVTEFGENKPQELKEKHDILPAGLHFHMIGHLQRNKVKYVVGRAFMIHSLDSLRLAEAVQEEAAKQGISMPVLVEVNVAGEESKFGLTMQETPEFVEKLAQFPNLCVKGLMTIAPFVENPEDNRVHFRNLYNLFIDIKARNHDNDNMCILSMGMTNDYEIAVEEGATMVRVGTGIFGERDYHTTD